MKSTDKILRIEFEYRIFVSLGIVAAGALSSFLVFNNFPSLMLLIGRAAGMDDYNSKSLGFGLIVLIIICASAIRMWSGSLLSSARVMSFKVNSDDLTTEGPYKLVRNPIYFADFLAMISFSLCLHPIGLLIPVLIYFHYLQLIRYEEINFESKYRERYEDYLESTPKLIPTLRSSLRFLSSINNFRINKDGFRHNALYILFIPGFIISIFTHEFIYALVIGLPAVIDWAIIHTIIGINPTKKGEMK